MDHYVKECLRLFTKYNCGSVEEKAAYHRELDRWERFDIPFVEMTMTTRCTLRCRYCSNLIPLHSTPEHFPKEEVLDDLDRLLDRVDWIYRLKLHGGEPLSYPWLDEVLQYALSKPQIKEVRASTNGTLLPDAGLLSVMKDPRFILHISGYAAYRESAEALIDLLDRHQIRWYYMEGQRWQDLGDPWQKRGRSGDELAALAENCNMRKCTAYYHGKIFVCSFAANRYQLSESKDALFVDLHDPNNDAASIRRFFLHRSYPECDWCSGILPDGPEIEAGEQL